MDCWACLYRGSTLATAKVVASSADPELVRATARGLLKALAEADSDDPALGTLVEGRRRALQIIAGEDSSGRA